MYTFVDFTIQIIGRRGVPCPTNKGVSYTNLVCWLGSDLKNRLLLLLLLLLLCNLVKSCHSLGKGYYWEALIGVTYPYLFHTQNFPSIFLPLSYLLGMVVTCIPKRFVLHSPMRRRGLNARGCATGKKNGKSML
jgi:hypothetical protein